MNVDHSVVTTAGLCAGAGMLDLGVSLALEYLGYRAKPAFVAEWDSYSAAVLKSRMEEASLEPCPIWCGDMADFDGRPWAGAVDMLVAGIPCQPFSVAGKQEGVGDERWLWPELFRIIRECGPSIVFIENVPGFVRGGLGPMLSDLASIGFDAEWLSLTAESVGASHRRERVFILAYLADNPLARSGRVPESGDGTAAADADGKCSELGDATGINGGQRQRQRFGSAAVAGGESGAEGSSPIVGDASGLGEREQNDEAGPESQRSGPRRGTGGTGGDVADAYGLPIFAPGPSDPRWPELIDEWPWLAPAVESGVRVSLNGSSLVLDQGRADQLRCAGNGCVVIQSSLALMELVRRIS